MALKNSAVPASYVLFEKDDKVLFARRCNTGYCDGMYQMPAGHVDPGEGPVEAAVREMKEEVGVDITPEDLEFVHVAYRLSDDKSENRVDFFYKVSKWSGEITNMEPEKCDDMAWVTYDALPENTVGFIVKVMASIQKGEFLSEIMS